VILRCEGCGQGDVFVAPEWSRLKRLDRTRIFGVRGTAYRSTHRCGGITILPEQVAKNLMQGRQRAA